MRSRSLIYTRKRRRERTTSVRQPSRRPYLFGLSRALKKEGHHTNYLWMLDVYSDVGSRAVSIYIVSSIISGFISTLLDIITTLKSSIIHVANRSSIIGTRSSQSHVAWHCALGYRLRIIHISPLLGNPIYPIKL